ncbi:MAG: hypothetical protein ACRD1G_11840, partial [Acidimicrobiales bacterium]
MAAPNALSHLESHSATRRHLRTTPGSTVVPYQARERPARRPCRAGRLWEAGHYGDLVALVSGYCDAGFEAVREAFVENLDDAE